MSFNRLNYDTCQYKQVLAETTGPVNYVLGTPSNTCDPCFINNPSIRLQKSGNGVDTSFQSLIDTDSELMNITRPNSKCPSRKFLAQCSGGVGVAATKEIPRDCTFVTDETRTSNPPQNLRGTGWNRWETLCKNPQSKVLIPFDYNIQNRIVVKDNHRPCIPTPIDVNPSLPHGRGGVPCQPTTTACYAPTEPRSVHWQDPNVIGKY